MSEKKRVVLIGASCRGMYAFAKPLVKEHAETHDIVGVFDINRRRSEVLNEFVEANIPIYEDVDVMLRETKPEIAVITTIDATHVDYIEKCFELGIAMVSEKPLCANEDQCRRIRVAQQAHPDVRAITAHNYRYAPPNAKIKQLILDGELGEIHSVVFQELLDHRHGSSYFRRWNRSKKYSGGLPVHKACHCFDLINWWVGSKPKTLSAKGSLGIYGPESSKLRGERCGTCEHTEECPQYYKIDESAIRSALYLRAWKPGDYTPDLCVYSEEVDTVDHATIGYDYENGVRVTFDLCAFSTYEGVNVVIEGSKGRLEFFSRYSTKPMEKDAAYGSETISEQSMEIFRFDGPKEVVTIDEDQSGGHGGADPKMFAELFLDQPPTIAQATLEEGIQAVLIGSAVNISIAEQRPVDVQSLMS